MSIRLSLAADAIPSGPVIVFGAGRDVDLSALGPARTHIVQDSKPDVVFWESCGFRVSPELGDLSAEAAIVCIPRSKAQARDYIAQACRAAPLVFVDGLKTSGIESLLKEIKRRRPLLGVMSKAHGKLAWFEGGSAFADWRAQSALLEGRWQVLPGVFSADGVDPGSRLLGDNLPDLTGSGADLGAGWGYLSARLLETSPGIDALHLVEAQKRSLDCAEANVADPRAHMHWADVTKWQPPQKLDFVVMNPPFHIGRSAEPALGMAFIQAAARMLNPRGSLYLVANRHLPYEAELAARFKQVEEFGGDNRFKLLRGSGLSRA